MTATFIIEAYSDTTGPSLWCEAWQCWRCGFVMSPQTVDFTTHCPLHNPMHCSGRNNGQSHGIVACRPIPGAEVFTLDHDRDGAAIKTPVGRIPRV